MLASVLNVVGFQLVWLSCVAGAGAGLGWPGAIAAILFVGLQLRASKRRQRDLHVLMLAAPLGWVTDSLLAASGLLVYAASPWAPVAPLWIVALWAGFALTVHHSLAFLASRPVLGVLFGAVGGPVAYLGAERVFSAVEIAPNGLLAVGLCWAVVMPLLYAADRLVGVANREQVA